MEEYSELKKTWDSRGKKSKSKQGRCDLYVAFRDKAYILEAKMIWPSLARSDWREKVLERLRDARDDVRKTHAPDREKKLGMLIGAIVKSGV